MAKLEFTQIAAIGYNAPEEQDEALSMGNAFAGASDKTAHDREMWNAMHAQNISGDDAFSSSIAGAQARSANASSVGAAKREKDASRRGAQSFYNAMMQKQLADMGNTLRDWGKALRKEQKDLGEQIEALGELRELIASGQYDGDNPDHARLYQEAFPEDSKADKQAFDDMTISQQLDIVDDTNDAAQERIDEIENRLPQIDEAIELIEDAENGIEIPMKNGRFLNPLLEEARQNIGLDLHDEMLNSDHLDQLSNQLRDIKNDDITEGIINTIDNENIKIDNEDLKITSEAVSGFTFG
ncbi:MAG: hypothetical protein ACLFR0_02160 [Alphaproteobacteria bacterium]